MVREVRVVGCRYSCIGVRGRVTFEWIICYLAGHGILQDK